MEFSLLAPVRLAIFLPFAALICFCWMLSALPRKSWLAATQMLLAAALSIALADIVTISLDQLSRPGSTFFVQDKSESMDALPDYAKDVKADGVVAFVEARSDLASGVVNGSSQGASALMIKSDGRETTGNFLAAARELDRPLFAFTPPQGSDMRIVDVLATPNRPDRSFDVDVVIESNVAAEATLTIRVDDEPIAKSLSVTPGRRDIRTTVAAHGREQATIDVELASDADRETRNNRFRAAWRALPRSRVVVVYANTSQREKLGSQLSSLGLQPEFSAVAEISEQTLEGVDCLVLLADAAKITGAQQGVIEKFVATGGGLIVAGGGDVYGADALSSSNWKAWLPVSESTSTHKVSRPSFAMVLVIDKSESMQYENRLSMAKQAASQAVELLDEADQVGVLAFGTNSRWLSEIAASGDKKAVLSRIAGLEVEGETNMYPAIERAQLALEQVDAEHKHLILLTDGVSSPGDFGEVAERLKGSGISVATVSVSTGAEQLVLQDIARIASGRHYHCDDANELPNILVRAARQAVEKIGPARFSVFEMEGGLKDVPMKSSPPLTGVVETSPKDDTVLAYLTDDGQPLIVWRKHEAGMVASIVCDSQTLLDAAWTRWAGFESFWRSLVSKVERKSAPEPISITGRFVDSQFELHVDVRNGEQWDSDGTVYVTLESDGSKRIPARLIAPGHYVAAIPIDGSRSSISGRAFIGQGSVEHTRGWRYFTNYSSEYRHVGADLDLLRSASLASGGAMIESIEDIPEATTEPSSTAMPVIWPLWYWFVVGAILLLLVETCQRRWNRGFGVV